MGNDQNNPTIPGQPGTVSPNPAETGMPQTAETTQVPTEPIQPVTEPVQLVTETVQETPVQPMNETTQTPTETQTPEAPDVLADFEKPVQTEANPVENTPQNPETITQPIKTGGNKLLVVGVIFLVIAIIIGVLYYLGFWSL